MHVLAFTNQGPGLLDETVWSALHGSPPLEEAPEAALPGSYHLTGQQQTPYEPTTRSLRED